MGAANSREPRSVSMDNPTAGVLDISDEVVSRLKKGISNQAKQNAEAKTVRSAEPPTATPTTPKAESVRAAPAAPAAPALVYTNPTPVIVSSGGHTITAADMRRQKEIELQQNDAQWRKRMADLEITLKKTNDIMEKEYSSAVEDVRKRFATASPTHKVAPCQELKAQVIACYRANPRESLRCNEEVNQFRSCVNMQHIKKLDPVVQPTATEAAPKAVKAA